MYTFFNSKITLGVDIQANQVSLVYLQYRGSYHSVKKFAITVLPPGTIVDGHIKTRSAIVAALREWVQLPGLYPQSIAITLPTQHFITTRIKLSHYLKEHELAAEIQANLTRYFPGMSSELCFDFVIIGHEQGTYDILLVATRIQTLMDYINLLEEAGLKVTQVASPLFAALRVMPILFAGQNYFGMIEINLTSAHLIIMHQQKILFSQLLSYVSSDELTMQLKQVLQTWQTTHATNPLQNIYWLGEDKYLTAVRHSIESTCHLQIGKVDMSALVKKINSAQSNLDDVNHTLAISYGLALQNKKMPTVNLLAWRKKQYEKKHKRFNIMLLVGLNLIGCFYIVIHFSLQSTLTQKNIHIKKLTALLAQKRNQVKLLKQMQKDSRQFVLIHQTLMDNFRQQNELLNIFYHMLTDMPDDVSLQTLACKANQIYFSGLTYSSQSLGEWLRSFPNAAITQMDHVSESNTFKFQINISQ